MTLRSGNALLQEPRVARLRQQRRIMVAFKQERMALLQGLHHMAAAMAQIGQHAQMHIAIGATKLQRLTRIVWNGKGMELQSPQINGCPVSGNLKLIRAEIPLRQIAGQCRAFAHPNRGAGFLGKRTGMADVIGVFMGDEYRIDVFQAEVRCRETFAQFTQAQAAINEQA